MSGTLIVKGSSAELWVMILKGIQLKECILPTTYHFNSFKEIILFIPNIISVNIFIFVFLCAADWQPS